MPGVIESNPLFANNPPGSLLTPHEYDYWGLDPNIALSTLTSLVPTHLATNQVTPGLGVGAVVEIQSWNGATSGASGSPTHPTVALSATTADGSIVGVIDGTTVGGQGVSVTGQAVRVVRYGICPVIVDNTCTAGHALVQSTGTAGAAHDSGGVGGTQNETIGICLEAVTVSSGLGLTLCLVKLT